jgi:hypothetical protein
MYSLKRSDKSYLWQNSLQITTTGHFFHPVQTYNNKLSVKLIFDKSLMDKTKESPELLKYNAGTFISFIRKKNFLISVAYVPIKIVLTRKNSNSKIVVLKCKRLQAFKKCLWTKLKYIEDI